MANGLTKKREAHIRDLHKKDDRPGEPTSTTHEAQNKSADSSTRNYLKEAFNQYTGGDVSKLKGTTMLGRTILARAQGKGNWTKEGAMAQRKAQAQAQGKGNWNAQDEMKKRREAAQAQGKGNWNAQDEMRKRREAAQAKKGK